jgi:hypothetical protein
VSRRDWRRDYWQAPIAFDMLVMAYLLGRPEHWTAEEEKAFGPPPDYLCKLAERAAERVLELADGDPDLIDAPYITQATVEIAPQWATDTERKRAEIRRRMSEGDETVLVIDVPVGPEDWPDGLDCQHTNAAGGPCRGGFHWSGTSTSSYYDTETWAVTRQQRQEWSQRRCRYHYDPSIEPPDEVVIRFAEAPDEPA